MLDLRKFYLMEIGSIIKKIIESYKKFSSAILKIVKLPLKDLNYEELPLYNKILQKIKGIKREKIKNCQIRNVIIL